MRLRLTFTDGHDADFRDIEVFKESINDREISTAQGRAAIFPKTNCRLNPAPE